MAKFSLTANPTFRHTIAIPVPGDEDATLAFTFRHLTVKQLQAAEEKMRKGVQEAAVLEDQAARDKANTAALVAFIQAIATDWDTEDAAPFTAKNIAAAIDAYPSFMGAVSVGYTREMWCLREK